MPVLRSLSLLTRLQGPRTNVSKYPYRYGIPSCPCGMDDLVRPIPVVWLEEPAFVSPVYAIDRSVRTALFCPSRDSISLGPKASSRGSRGSRGARASQLLAIRRKRTPKLY